MLGRKQYKMWHMKNSPLPGPHPYRAARRHTSNPRLARGGQLV